MKHDPHPSAGTKARDGTYACTLCSKRVSRYIRDGKVGWRHVPLRS